MTAAVIELSAYVAQRGGGKSRSAGKSPVASKPVQDTVASQDETPKFDFCFWQGATGERYVHHVYGLIDCPQVPAANYILFAREEDGSRRVVHIGVVEHEAPSLNLAEIRHRGAKLGAREVHVHMLADTKRRRAAIKMDLRSGLAVDGDNGPISG